MIVTNQMVQEAAMDEWKDTVLTTIIHERLDNIADAAGLASGTVKEQIGDRVDALLWVERILPKMASLLEFVSTVERERDSNFARHDRTRKRAYSTTAHALDWVVREVTP